MPKSRRLLRAGEFREVLNRARRLRTAMFTAAVAANDLDHPRLGITVSRRVDGRATARNRIRRVVREEFRLLQNRLPPADIVLLATQRAAAETNAALRHDLEQLLHRIERAYASDSPAG